MPGVSVKDVDQGEFVKALAAFLKKSGKVRVPDWCDLMKTGVHKELAPYDDDWFFIRGASMARHLYIRAPVGVGAFCRMYGGIKNNGTAPSHFSKSSNSVARRILQALETLKMVEKDTNGGRRLTASGRRDMDRIASQLRAKTKKARATAPPMDE